MDRLELWAKQEKIETKKHSILTTLSTVNILFIFCTVPISTCYYTQKCRYNNILHFVDFNLV